MRIRRSRSPSSSKIEEQISTSLKDVFLLAGGVSVSQAGHDRRTGVFVSTSSCSRLDAPRLRVVDGNMCGRVLVAPF